MHQNLPSEELGTRERIMAAALPVFRDHGFDNATVRRICRDAGANVAAVNYHFKDKNGLYLAVLDRLFHKAFTDYPPDMGTEEGLEPEERLRVYIRAFLFRLMKSEDLENYDRMGEFISRALSEPSAALDVLVEKYIRPLKNVLRAILDMIFPKDAPAEVKVCCGVSIVGQCLHLLYYRPVALSLDPERPDLTISDQTLEWMSGHIYDFSLGGIREIIARGWNK